MGKRALLLSFAFWTLVGAFQASNWVCSPIADAPSRLALDAVQRRADDVPWLRYRVAPRGVRG